jgi:hypothetical protein
VPGRPAGDDDHLGTAGPGAHGPQLLLGLSVAGTKSLRIKLTRKAKRSLAHTRSVRLQLRTRAADLLGNQSPTNSRSLRLRR